jgi:hypothetical protein
VEPADDGSLPSRVGDLPAGTGDAEASTRGRRWLGLDVLLLLGAPAFAFFALRVRPMYNFDSVDANIYTGYAQNAPDLIMRWGAGVYYWVRLGAILPERLAYLAFGAVPGFYVLRYALVLLITVPLFLLFRRLVSRAAGWLAVSLFLTSPVMYVALGSDYPDSLIFAYLPAAFVLLFMPWRGLVARLVSWTLAGVLLALALHSQVVSAPLVAAMLVAFVVATVGRGFGRLFAAVGCVAVGGLGITAVLMLVARTWLGVTNIFSPTISNYVSLQAPEWLKLWHSSDPAWASTVPYIVVPAVVGLAWLVTLATTRAQGLTRVETGAGAWLLLSMLVMTYMQFRGTVATLEYRLYSSSLWPPTLILLAFVLLRMVGALRSDRSRATWVTTGLVWVVGLVASFSLLSGASPSRTLTGAVSVVLVALTIATVVRSVALRTAVAGLVCLGLMFLTVSPTSKPDGEGFSVLPQAHYDLVLGHAGDREDVVYYQLATQIVPVVGPATARGQVAVFWGSSTVPGRMVNAVSGTYLWWRLPTGMSDTAAGREEWLRAAKSTHPDPLVILASTPQEAESMVAYAAGQGLQPQVSHRGALQGDGVTVEVVVVRVAG